MIPVLRPGWNGLAPPVQALSTLREGGVSSGPYAGPDQRGGLNLGLHVGDREQDVLENRRRLRAMLPAEPAWLTQVHGSRVLDAGQVRDAPEADACIATRPGQVCVIMTADCMPVLLADLGGRAVGAAHAGWRGLAGGVLENTVAAMRAAGAGDIVAWLGPAIGPQHFEVGEDVLTAFAALDRKAQRHFRARDGMPGKYLADLYSLARDRLAACGVQQVDGGEYCTVADAKRFYSYRRDRITGRMATLIWLD